MSKPTFHKGIYVKKKWESPGLLEHLDDSNVISYDPGSIFKEEYVPYVLTPEDEEAFAKSGLKGKELESAIEAFKELKGGKMVSVFKDQMSSIWKSSARSSGKTKTMLYTGEKGLELFNDYIKDKFT